MSVDDAFARVAVFVDQAFRRPGQRIFQNVVRMLGQGADPQLHGSQTIEVPDELARRDADESRGQAALRCKRLVGTMGNRSDPGGYFDVFSQIEIVNALSTRDFCNTWVDEIRQARNDGGGSIRRHDLCQSIGIGCIE